jgi:hypothetical protein
MGKPRQVLALQTPVSTDDLVGMESTAALAALLDCATTNGFTGSEFIDAMKLFKDAAAITGVTIYLPTAYDGPAMRHAERVHDLMQAITDGPVTTDLALVATGAQPGTHFRHSLRGDLCELTNVCTNQV